MYEKHAWVKKIHSYTLERVVTVQAPIWKDIGMHAAAKIKFGTGFTLRENRKGILLFNSKTQT